MKITIESTTKVIEFEIARANGFSVVPARIWEGFTEDGIPVHCYITRICPSIPIPELTPEVEAKFARDLLEQKPPTPAVKAIDARFIL